MAPFDDLHPSLRQCKCGHAKAMHRADACEMTTGPSDPHMYHDGQWLVCPCLHFVPEGLKLPKIPERLPLGMRAA